MSLRDPEGKSSKTRLRPPSEPVILVVKPDMAYAYLDVPAEVNGYLIEGSIRVPGEKRDRYISLRIGPMYDGSGQAEAYPDGVIRSVPEAQRIAEAIAAVLNAAGGIRL